MCSMAAPIAALEVIDPSEPCLCCRFDGHAQRPQLATIGVDLMEGQDLFNFQFGYLFGPGPGYRTTLCVGFVCDNEGTLLIEAERLAQHIDDKLEGMVVVVFEN